MRPLCRGPSASSRTAPTPISRSSTITGQASGVNRALEVDAYQTTNIAIGGGSLYMSGGKVGLGLALTYASIGDPSLTQKATDAHILSTSISNYDTLLVLADSASVIASGAASGGAGGNGLAGAIIVGEITPTITAYIDSNSTVNINVGRVTVVADSGAVASLDTALGNLVKKSNNNHLASDTCTAAGGMGGQSSIDFSAAALNDGSPNGPGASIVSVAGTIQAGKNNVGASLIYNTIATTHSAYIANVLMTAATANGDVSVSARDSTKIQAVTIGLWPRHQPVRRRRRHDDQLDLQYSFGVHRQQPVRARRNRRFRATPFPSARSTAPASPEQPPSRVLRRREALRAWRSSTAASPTMSAPA